MRRRLAAILIFTLLLGLIGGVFWLQHGTLSLDRIAAQENQLRQGIASRPAIAFAAGFFIYTLLSLVPGAGGKAVIFGWLFGFWQGAVIVNGALTLAAVGGFLFSRYLFLDLVQERFHDLAFRLEQTWRRDGAFYLLTLRLVGAPYSLTNYTAGATGVPTWTFWWTTQFGLLPRAAVWVFLGARLPSLNLLVERGVMSLVDPTLIVALTLLALVPAVLRFGLRRPLCLGRRRHAEPPR